jgi:hypothetical protein
MGQLRAKIATAGLLLLAVVGSTLRSYAAPINYTISFTTNSGISPSSGSFTFDSAQPLGSQFTAFTVVWDSISFNLTSTANAPQTSGSCTATSLTVFLFLTGTPECPGTGGQPIGWGATIPNGSAIAFFNIFDVSSGGANAINIQGTPTIPTNTGPTVGANGGFSASPVPEPSSLLLMGSALGCLLLASQRLRVRIGR